MRSVGYSNFKMSPPFRHLGRLLAILPVSWDNSVCGFSSRVSDGQPQANSPTYCTEFPLRRKHLKNPPYFLLHFFTFILLPHYFFPQCDSHELNTSAGTITRVWTGRIIIADNNASGTETGISRHVTEMCYDESSRGCSIKSWWIFVFFHLGGKTFTFKLNSPVFLVSFMPHEAIRAQSSERKQA